MGITNHGTVKKNYSEISNESKSFFLNSQKVHILVGSRTIYIIGVDTQLALNTRSQVGRLV